MAISNGSLFEGAIAQLKRRRILTAKADAHDLALVRRRLPTRAADRWRSRIARTGRSPTGCGLRVNRLRSFATDPRGAGALPCPSTCRRAGDETGGESRGGVHPQGLATGSESSTPPRR